MATSTEGLSDKALSIFTFAAYHRLLSGERVTSVIRTDGKGHQADPDGVAELEQRGLATVSERDISFGDEAGEFVETIVAALRGQVGR